MLFVFDGWDHPDLGVQAVADERVDVFRDRELEALDRFPWAAVADEFGFEERVERFGEGIVVTVPTVPFSTRRPTWMRSTTSWQQASMSRPLSRSARVADGA